MPPPRRQRVAEAPEGKAAAAKYAVPLTSEEAQDRAHAEGLTLLKGSRGGSYFGVGLVHVPGGPKTAKPYRAQVRHGGQGMTLGTFANQEEAALCVARTPEGKKAVAKAVAKAAKAEAARPVDAPLSFFFCGTLLCRIFFSCTCLVPW